MKSSAYQLKNRGYITLEELNKYKDLTKVELIELIKSPEPYRRTTGVRLLSEIGDLDQDTILFFLKTLIQEEKLYTKIELCHALQRGGLKSVEPMVKFLGVIGVNQYKVLPKHISYKKSYPLPRDIIARTLAYMDQEILPELLKVLLSNNVLAIREVIDSIGFICFYNEVSMHDLVLDSLILCFKKYLNDDIIRWKSTLAFRNFNSEAALNILMYIKGNDNQLIIRDEATRSIRIVNGGK